MTKAEPQRPVDQWNATHPVGTEVIVTRDMGEELRTKTRSMAWVLSGHTPVIMVDGISGCYLLERVRPATINAAVAETPAEPCGAGHGERSPCAAPLSNDKKDDAPTPRTDAVDAVADDNYGTDMYQDMLEHARQLERELAEAQSDLRRASSQSRKVTDTLNELGAPDTDVWEGMTVALSQRGRIKRLVVSSAGTATSEPDPDRDYIVTKLEQRILVKHGGKAEHGFLHMNLTEGDSAMHFEAAQCIKAMVRHVGERDVTIHNLTTAINAMNSTPQSASTECKASGIYVASRVKQADVWKAYRSRGWKINATWIDESGEGETADFGELWERLRGEIARSHALVFYAAGVEDFPFKGALVEVGMALAMRKPVIVALENVMLDGRTLRPVGSWLLDRNVIRCDTLEEAMEIARGAELLCATNAVTDKGDDD